MDIKAGRYTAHYPDGFVLVLIGLRINALWRVHEWLPVMRAAFAMTRELQNAPDSPLLNSQPVWSASDRRVFFFVQHWTSFEALMQWANNEGLQHRPAQRAFFKRTAYNGHVGIWHEAYKIAPGQFEAIYANMPGMSLAAAGDYRPLSESSRGHDRMGNPRAT